MILRERESTGPAPDTVPSPEPNGAASTRSGRRRARDARVA